MSTRGHRARRVAKWSTGATCALIAALTPLWLEISLPTSRAAEELPGPQATLDLEWEQVEDADAYDLKLTPAGGGDPLKFTLKESKFSERVPVGVYQLQIRSRDKTTGYYGPWSAPREIEVTSKVVELVSPGDGEQLAAPKDRRLNVVFEWRPVPGAKKYTLKVWSDDPNNAKEFQVLGSTKELSLPTGRTYFWQVTFQSEQDISYRATPLTYSFNLLGPQLLQPIIDRNIGLPHVTKINWSVSPGAEFYTAKLYRRYIDEDEFTEYKEVEKTESNFMTFGRLPPGGYRIVVTANSKSRVSSDEGFYEFIVKPTEAELMAKLGPLLGVTPTPTPEPEAGAPSAPTPAASPAAEGKIAAPAKDKSASDSAPETGDDVDDIVVPLEDPPAK